MPVVYASIIDAIGKKLYTGNIIWIREYIQNAIDANANKITIEVQGKDLKITDDGDGMGLDEINEQLFSIGGSVKPMDKIGQFGIGMYAGSGVCEKISVRTRKKGFPIYVSEIDLKQYREEIGLDEYGRVTERKLFEEVMPKIFTLKRLDDPSETREHFTEIRFSEVDDNTIHMIIDGEGKRLKEVLIDYVPVPINEKFPFEKEIKEFLGEEEKTVDISVIIEGKQFKITKFEDIPPSELSGWIITKDIYDKEPGANDRKLIAKLWAVYSSSGKSLGKYSSLLVKFKGMTVGDKTVISSKFGSKETKRYIGEIVVKDYSLQLNTERNWFIESPSLEIFIKRVKKELDQLYEVANFDSKLGHGLQNKIYKLEELEKKYSDELSKGNNYNARVIESKINNIGPKLEERINELENTIKKFDSNKKEDDPYAELKRNLINTIRPTVDEFKKEEKLEDKKVIEKPKWDPARYIRSILEKYVVDKRITEVAAKKNSKDTLTNIFTLIDTVLKEKSGLDKNTKLEREEDLINAFYEKNRPPDYVPKEYWERYHKDFKSYILSLYGLFRNEAVHTFIEHFDNDRNNLQFLLMGDLLLEMINSWIPKDPKELNPTKPIKIHEDPVS